MKRTGHVARVGELKNACRILDGILNGRDYVEDLGVDGRIISI
jgi:hypothetical protein